MKPMLRYGSGWKDVESQVKAITEKGIDSRHFILCTDDSHAETLVEEGHMDRVLRHAIKTGLDPMAAIQMATINTAEHFGLDREIGQIAPGRYADVVLVSDLYDFKAETVIAKGKVIAESKKLHLNLPSFPYPEWVRNSVHLGQALSAEDFRLPAPGGDTLFANVIGVVENQAPTKHLTMEVSPINDEVKIDLDKDILKIALIERHKGTSSVTIGLVNGFGLQGKCAIATTVAHDSHHMIVVGTDENQMAFAAQRLSEVEGGQIVVKDSEVVGLVELPIAGLMSNEPADVVAQKAATVLEGFKVCGCKLNNPNMQLSLLALVVIPELRISDMGLVDVTKFEIIPVVYA
jgi:adenine deaminase